MESRGRYARPLWWAGVSLALVTLAGWLLPDPSPVHAAEGKTRIEINLPAYRLTLFKGDEAVASYPVAIGAPDRKVGKITRVTATPTGRFTIGKKTKNPSWFPPSWFVREQGWADGFFIGPGPSNPLGVRWLGLSRPGYVGYGIHGTADDASIGHAVSLGCVRMRNRDVVGLFDRVQVGTPVDIVDRRVEVVRDENGRALIALYPDVYHRGRPDVADVRAALRAAGLDEHLGDDAFWKKQLAAAGRSPVYVAVGEATAALPPVPSRVQAVALEKRLPDRVQVSIARATLGFAERQGDDYLLPVAQLPEAFRAHFDRGDDGQVLFYGQPMPGAVVRDGEALVPVRAMGQRLHMTERWLDTAWLDLSW